jgi:ATP-dependent Clp protease ATP-binding subunit ClpA
MENDDRVRAWALALRVRMWREAIRQRRPLAQGGGLNTPVVKWMYRKRERQCMSHTSSLYIDTTAMFNRFSKFIEPYDPRVVAQNAKIVVDHLRDRYAPEPEPGSDEEDVSAASQDAVSDSKLEAASVAASQPTQKQDPSLTQPKPTKLSSAKEPQPDKFAYAKKVVHGVADIVSQLWDTDVDTFAADVIEIKPLVSLAKYGRNLLENVPDDPIVGRDSETDRVIEILCQRQKNNPVLVGEPGVGKTAIVEGLAQRLKAGNVPRLAGFAFYELDLGLLTADTKYRGDLEKRIVSILDEIRLAPVILFIDEIHVLLGSQAAAGAAELLKPAMGRGEIRMVGATTLDEYRAHIEKNPAFERRMTRVMVEEPSIEQTIRLLEKIKFKYELFHTVIISDEAIRAAAELSTRYMKSRFNPDKSIELIDEACSSKSVSFDAKGFDDMSLRHFKKFKRASNLLRVQLKNLPADNSMAEVLDAVGGVGPKSRSDILNEIDRVDTEIMKYKKYETIASHITVTQEDIRDIVTRKTGIPLSDEKEQLAGMAERLRGRVTGQDEAVNSVVSAIIRTRLGLDTGKRPTGCFLFAGPTGVGKTEMAKALSAELFGDESHMVRIDMSEYSSPESVSRLIGAPPGYVGYESGGQLTEPVRRRPYNVVLMDEIEKASPRVLTILLQLMDDGRLTDGQGRTVDFTSTVVILTTNLGHASFYNDQTPAVVRTNVLAELGKHVQPEFLNRLDDTILFWPLSQDSIRQLVKQAVSSLNARLAARRISCVADDSAIDWIAQKAYDPKMGARPLQNLINKQIVDRIGDLLMKGKLDDGQSVQLTIKDGSLDVIPGAAMDTVAAKSTDKDDSQQVVPMDTAPEGQSEGEGNGREASRTEINQNSAPAGSTASDPSGDVNEATQEETGAAQPIGRKRPADGETRGASKRLRKN